MTTDFICTTCGTQFGAAPAPPPHCPICREERQYEDPQGQRWTSLAALGRSHANSFRQIEDGLLAIRTVPDFAIGQRALLVLTPAGNVLWDCLSLLDAATIRLIEGLGGLAAIAVSHPHYYASMADWSTAFGGVPVYLHAADRDWAMRRDGNLVFWEGDTYRLQPGLTLIRCSGHFAGGTVLHWAAGAEGRGALLSGDILQVVADGRHVSFMRSYPNLIPLSAAVVARIAARLSPFAFERIHGAFEGRSILADAGTALSRSAERYIDAVSGRGPADREG